MSSLERQLQKVTIATIRAREKAKIDLISYFRSESLIPKKTHRLVESAVNNLLTYGLGSEFELMVWFDTFYANKVENRTHFLEIITPNIYQIIQNALASTYASMGIKSEVLING